MRLCIESIFGVENRKNAIFGETRKGVRVRVEFEDILKLGFFSEKVWKRFLGAGVFGFHEVVFDAIKGIVRNVCDSEKAGIGVGEADQESAQDFVAKEAIAVVFCSNAVNNAIKPHGVDVALETKGLNNSSEPLPEFPNLLLIDLICIAKISRMKVPPIVKGNGSFGLIGGLSCGFQKVVKEGVGKEGKSNFSLTSKRVEKHKFAFGVRPLAFVGNDNQRIRDIARYVDSAMRRCFNGDGEF